jgi:hypothetical protein
MRKAGNTDVREVARPMPICLFSDEEKTFDPVPATNSRERKRK